ncbi:vWA domain-containing protein [Egicoccus halophilus]|uniref:VWA domain-containing protein n=1 Tax=Egicoccus halophilus TaxID=1670830 RepID=A0A8J3A8H1_9ACTN|nr:VWA domain-containing protein [Egicoccus halophilus]GGI06867.1 VWA domain-containing protein [Egicoccus halophilus]
MDERVADVLAEGPPPVNGLLQRVLDFVQALRRAGVGPTQSEAIDAVRTLPHLDLLDRTQLREALAAVTVTSVTHRRAFDDLFALYFPARPAGDGSDRAVEDAGDGDGELDPESYLDELLDRLMEGDEETIRQMARLAVDQFGRVEGRDGGVSYFQYKVFRAVDLQQLLRDMLGRTVDDAEQLTPLQERLHRDEFEARLRAFRQEVEAEIRRRAAADRGLEQVADRMTRPPVEELDFFHLSVEDQAALRAQIRPLARKLASRVSVKRRQGKDGRLDVRRTVRESLSTGGVPFDPHFRPRRPHKPELFVICDVSGSVASFARFTLLLVHALQEQFSKVRSFAFIDTLDEVTRLFERGDPTDAMQRMLAEAELVWLDGHSDYGHSLERFHTRYARDLTPRSTVLILGDARNNYRQANAWVLQDLARRARRVYWLNPEPIQFWDTGDSISSSYARFVEDMVEVRNLKQLATFVERIA